MRRFTILLLAAWTLLGLAPLDSQLVLERYELQMSDLKPPKASIFIYSVSQAGVTDIEQRHQIYRSGVHVRDETLSVDGKPLARKIVTIARRPDRYFVGRVAPRASSYTMLFLRPIRDGRHLDYEYQTTPLVAQGGGFVVTHVTIDGISFLPKTIDFTTASADAKGTGSLTYGKVGSHWVPLAATIEATVSGKPSRERIEWSDYRFPPSLPASTFNAPKPLPESTLPPFRRRR